MANTVRIVVEADDKASGKLKGIQGALGDIGKIAGGIVVAQGISKLPGLFSATTDAAIDLGESTNAVNQIFGESAKEILDWSNENANSFGLTRAAFQQMATPLGAMLKNAGLGMDDVTKSTTDLTARAADMASVFNTDVEDALAAISAGLRGEADPLERYGVSLKAAAVEAKALAMTGKESAAALTEQEKATARVALIMEQTNDVAGDFAATSDEAANKARIQAAQQEELAAAIGQHLLPVQLKLTEAKLAFVKLLAEHLIPALAKTASWIGEHVVPKLQEFGAFLKTEIGPVIRDVVIPALEEFAAKTAEKFQEFKGYWEKDLRPALENIGEAFEWYIGFVIDNWKRLMPVVRPILDELRNRVETAFEIVAGVIDIVIQLLGGDFKGAWEAAQGLVKTVADSFVESMKNAGEMISGLVGVFKKAGTDIIQSLWDAAADKFRNHVVPWFKELPGNMAKAMGNVARLLFDKGVDVIQGLIDGMKSMKDRIPDPTSWIPGGGIVSDFVGGFVPQFRASGGPASGWTVVGENGPELARFPNGSHVFSNSQSRQMLAGGGGSTVNVTIQGPGMAQLASDLRITQSEVFA